MTSIQSRPSLDQIFNSGPSTSAQPSRPFLDQIFSGMQTLQPQAPAPEPGFFSRVNSDLEQRGRNLANIKSAALNQLPNETTLQVAGNEAGALGDVIGQSMSSAAKAGYQALPPAEQQALSGIGSAIANSQVGQSGIKALQAGKQAWDQFQTQNPRAARDISAMANIAGVVNPTGEEGAAAVSSAVDAAKSLSPETKVLPEELQGLQPVLDAKGSTILSKNPNAFEKGLQANQAISQSYDAAKARTAAADQMAREVGNQTPIPAEDVYDKLDSIIGKFEGKVAPGTQEASALDQLSTIRDNLAAKNPVISSFAGETPAERTILPGDLMDIEKTINAGLPDNKFLTTGTGQALNFKKTIQEAIARAGEENPDFADKYAAYKTEAVNLKRTFENNDSLKPFWQPEDWVAWKANKNNPAQSPLSGETLTRANKTLANLNTNDTSRIQAMINAMPPEQAQDLMRSAFVKAKKDQTSIPNALMALITLHPISALEIASHVIARGGAPTKLETTIKNLGKLAVHGSNDAQAAIPSAQQIRPNFQLKPSDSYGYTVPREDMRFDANGNFIKPAASIPRLPAPSPTLSLSAPEAVSIVDRVGNIRPMTPQERQAAALARQNALDSGLTPDVRGAQIRNEVAKAYEQRDLQRDAVKEEQIAKIAEQSSVPIDQLVDMADKNIKELAEILGKKGSDTAFAQALRIAVRNKRVK